MENAINSAPVNVSWGLELSRAMNSLACAGTFPELHLQKEQDPLPDFSI